MQKVFRHNLIYIFYMNEAVPNRFWIDDNHRPMLALIEAARLIGANAMF